MIFLRPSLPLFDTKVAGEYILNACLAKQLISIYDGFLMIFVLMRLPFSEKPCALLIANLSAKAIVTKMI